MTMYLQVMYLQVVCRCIGGVYDDVLTGDVPTGSL